jgi:hypothetical protein
MKNVTLSYPNSSKDKNFQIPKFLLLVFFLSNWVIIANAQSVNIIPPAQESEPFAANRSYEFRSSYSIPNDATICSYTWSAVSNATVDGASTNASARFKFTDNYGLATIRLRLLYYRGSSNCTSDTASVLRSITIAIRSLKGKAPELEQFGSQSGSNFSLRYCETNFQILLKAFMYPTSTNYNGGEVDGYEVTLPAGWSSDGRTGTFTTSIRYINLTFPNGCNTGGVKVRAYQNCGICPITSNYSELATFNLIRSPNQLTITTNPSNYTARCELKDPITLTTDAFSCATTYQWVLPTGWKGPNGQSVFNGGNSVTVTPNGTSAGSISVTAVLNCGINRTGAKTITFNSAVDKPTFATNSTRTLCPATAGKDNANIR